MKVDFFILGAPKCGTTSIAYYLSEHPQVCFSRPKEPRFFVMSDYALDCGDRSDEEYWKRYFSHFQPGPHRIAGEGTPMYLYFEESVPMILRYNPDARFVVMLRNPVDMVVSLHKNLLRGFNENVFSLEKAWHLQEERRAGRCMPPNPQIWFDLQYKQICSLGMQVSRLFSLVDRDRVKLIILDDLIQNPEEVYADLCSFLGVANDGRTDFKKVNAGREWKSRFLYNCYSGAYRVKTRLFGSRPLPFDLDKQARSLFMRDKPQNVHESRDFRQQLKAEFSDDVQLLGTLLERDLAGWIR
jgi:hypothetical protein